jgi:hypothetical protein
MKTKLHYNGRSEQKEHPPLLLLSLLLAYFLILDDKITSLLKISADICLEKHAWLRDYLFERLLVSKFDGFVTIIY